MEDSLTLFSDTDLKAIQPTGSAWAVTPYDPATVPVPTQVIIRKVEGPYTEKDRKLWTFLLHAVFDELGKTPMHTLSVRQINGVFRELGGDHGSEWIWESARRLMRTVAEWEALDADGDQMVGGAAIFGATLTKQSRSTGRLHFFFPPNLIPILKNPARFARLRVHFLISLSGKYAVTLYEILEAYVNRRDAMCRVTIDDLRRWLKVPDNTYSNWKDFRKWVLDPALKQINENPLGAGFTVGYKPIRKGRFYHEIVFNLTKTDGRKIAESRLRKADVKDRIRLSEKTEEIARAIASEKGWDYYALREKWFDYAARQTEKGQPPKSPNGAFIAYCRKQKRAR